MRMRLLRENDDPTLLADLERLAGREPEPIVDPADADAAGAATDGAAADDAEDQAEAGPLDDPFVRRFVQVSVHLKRYAPFYAGAALWALVMLLIQPVGRGAATSEVAGGPAFAGASSVAVATASADSAVADLNADAIGAPVFETVIGAAAFSEADSAFGDFTQSEFSAGDSGSDSGSSATTAPAFESTETVTFDDTEFGSEDEGFTIVRSGYASATGGTPAEQDPAGGALPVAVTLGNDTKRSFIELSGSGTVLRLRESPDGAVKPDPAMVTIKACVVTSDWEAERGQALADGPTYDTACSTGALFEGVWSFDLSNFLPEEIAKGIVLTPGPGTGHTFQVNLEPTPLEEGEA